jgi:adenine-specific DNA-methyltransferase
MSRLNDLLRRLKNSDSALAADLKREVDALADRRAFGLNFERHAPEAVELPGRKVLKNSKVRILPQRGATRTAEHDRLWQVLSVNRLGETATAELEALDGEDTAVASLNDLVVVAEFLIRSFLDSFRLARWNGAATSPSTA